MQLGAGRKREWTATQQRAVRMDDRVDSSGGAIETEMKRLRLAQEHDDSRARWIQVFDDGDTDMDVDEDGSGSGSGSGHACAHDYRAMNATLRQCHYMRQLRKFQAERVNYLERRPASESAAASVARALQERRN